MTKTLVSIGMSCQTAHQLARIAANHPEKVTFHKSPFDWLICPPESAARWLADDLPMFEPSELTIKRHRVYWERYGFWFWHGFYTKADGEKLLEIEPNTKRELSKLAYQQEQFANLDPSNTIFIASNKQNNLETDVFFSHEAQDYIVSAKKIAILHAALDRYFKSQTEFHFVTTKERSKNLPLEASNIHFLGKEQTEWKGDDVQWDALIETLI